MRPALRPLGLLACLIAGPAAAQTMGMPQELTLPPRAPGAEPGGSERPAGAELPFTSTAELRARTVARHVRELQATNPIAAAEVAREMSKHDYDAIFRSLLDGTGLRPTDAGDVLTAFVVLQWMVANDATAEPSPAALRAIREQFVMPMADKPPLSRLETRAAFAEQVKLRAVLHHAGWQAARRLGVVPRFLAGLSGEFIPPAKLRALDLTEEGLVAKGRARIAGPARRADDPPRVAEAPAEAPPAALPAEPRHAANWAQVEGVYFRATTGVGVGGMVTIDFEPLILLRDGSTYEIDDAALEDVDLAAERQAKPRRFGRWTRSGDDFVLTGTSGKPLSYRLQDGSFFKAFPAGAGETLSRGYRRLSGGGNSAMGGDVMIAVSSRYDFRPDGSYGRGGSVGATNSGATTGVGSALSRRRAPEGGRYALDRYTLTLTGADGRVRRLFFAFGSQKDPPQPDRDMIFIGDSVFSTAD
ncbi:hypothetical protein [Methylobacterium oryzisoli]|uniref:hypothetical protein n=1 Tax=Methylobacterium oryzisoli TaxID=3385502 RepID=UPI003892AA52